MNMVIGGMLILLSLVGSFGYSESGSGTCMGKCTGTFQKCLSLGKMSEEACKNK